MTDVRNSIVPSDACASREAGSFLAQLDDQLRRLTENTRDLTADDLAWQPAPGMNTIGMLLAHLAIVEVFWTQYGVLGETPDVAPVLGIGLDDDGMPLKAGMEPPAPLAGRDLAFFDDLLARARAHAGGVLARMKEADFERTFERTRPDGTTVALNVRWVVYHILEHFAGHYGQVLLLRHQRRSALAEAAARGVR